MNGDCGEGMITMIARTTKRMVDRLCDWIGIQLVSDVPGDIAACEFECKRPECSDERFVGCERRRRTEAMMAKTDRAETDRAETDRAENVVVATCSATCSTASAANAPVVNAAATNAAAQRQNIDA